MLAINCLNYILITMVVSVFVALLGVINYFHHREFLGPALIVLGIIGVFASFICKISLNYKEFSSDKYDVVAMAEDYSLEAKMVATEDSALENKSYITKVSLFWGLYEDYDYVVYDYNPPKEAEYKLEA